MLDCSKIEEVVADFGPQHRQGVSLFSKCPFCGADGKGKGLSVTPAKGIYKCFSCDKGGTSPANFLMEVKNISYPDAIKYLAEKYNVLIEYEKEEKGPQRKGGKKELTFRDRQLAASGLTDADQKTTVFVDDNTKKIVDVFESGTRDQYGKISPGDDMIIWYYDLEGKPVMFTKPKGSKVEHLFRVRWQNPDLHHDKNGRAMKYSSPSGSGSHLFSPRKFAKHIEIEGLSRDCLSRRAKRRPLKLASMALHLLV